MVCGEWRGGGGRSGRMAMGGGKEGANEMGNIGTMVYSGDGRERERESECVCS